MNLNNLKPSATGATNTPALRPAPEQPRSPVLADIAGIGRWHCRTPTSSTNDASAGCFTSWATMQTWSMAFSAINQGAVVGEALIQPISSRNGPACLSEIRNPTELTFAGFSGGASVSTRP